MMHRAEGMDLARTEEEMLFRDPTERAQAGPPAFRGGCSAAPASAVGNYLGA